MSDEKMTKRKEADSGCTSFRCDGEKGGGIEFTRVSFALLPTFSVSSLFLRLSLPYGFVSRSSPAHTVTHHCAPASGHVVLSRIGPDTTDLLPGVCTPSVYDSRRRQVSLDCISHHCQQQAVLPADS